MFIVSKTKETPPKRSVAHLGSEEGDVGEEAGAIGQGPAQGTHNEHESLATDGDLIVQQAAQDAVPHVPLLGHTLLHHRHCLAARDPRVHLLPHSPPSLRGISRGRRLKVGE